MQIMAGLQAVLIHSFYTDFVSAVCTSGTVLGAGSEPWVKQTKSPADGRAHIPLTVGGVQKSGARRRAVGHEGEKWPLWATGRTVTCARTGTPGTSAVAWDQLASSGCSWSGSAECERAFWAEEWLLWFGIFTGSHCQMCWGETTGYKDGRETHLEAATLIQEGRQFYHINIGGALEKGYNNKSGKKSSVSGCICKLETIKFTNNWVLEKLWQIE